MVQSFCLFELLLPACVFLINKKNSLLHIIAENWLLPILEATAIGLFN